MSATDVFKIAVKVFTDGSKTGGEDFMPVFQRWIQNQNVPGHTLIDAADYAHVANGPGTVLVSSEANFYTDHADGRLGLLYVRKLPLPGSFRQRLSAVITETLNAATRLEQDPGLHFRTDELLIRLNDRLLAPNNKETSAAIKPEVQTVMMQLFGNSDFTVEEKISPLTVYEIRVKTAQSPPLKVLLDRLASHP